MNMPQESFKKGDPRKMQNSCNLFIPAWFMEISLQLYPEQALFSIL